MMMPTTQPPRERASRVVRLGWRAALGAGLLLALASGGLTADPGDEFSYNGPGGVGTLPATKPDGLTGLPGPAIDPYGGATTFATSTPEVTAPGFVLRGLPDELNALIALAYGPSEGTAAAWYELSGIAPDGTQEIVFHGPLVLELDRAVLGSSGASLGLLVEPQCAGALVAALPSGRHVVPLPTGTTWLSIQRLVRAGLLEDGLSLSTVDRGPSGPMLSSTLHLRLEGRRIVIETTH